MTFDPDHIYQGPKAQYVEHLECPWCHRLCDFGIAEAIGMLPGAHIIFSGSTRCCNRFVTLRFKDKVTIEIYRCKKI